MTIIQRSLHDGASYEISANVPGYTGILVEDTDAAMTMIHLDRAGVRQLIEDLEAIAGLVPTAPTVGPAAALAGAVRRNFELIAELQKTDPAAAELLLASIAAHLRSTRPLLMAAQVEL
jgi:hypothetical protein